MDLASVPAKVPIAVVVPTHDTRKLTLECLESLARGHAVPEELIVVDDGSSDDTGEVVSERYPEARVLRNPQALGFSRAVNRGLAATTSPLLLMLNSDTEVAQDFLAQAVKAFAEQPRLGVAGAQLVNPDRSPQWSGGAKPSLVWMFAASSGLGELRGRLLPRRPSPSARLVDWVAGTALVLRREVWAEVGPLDETFDIYCQDLDLCLRAGDAGWQVRVLPQCRVAHYLGSTVGLVSGDRQDLAAMWMDLVRWAAKSEGAAAARRVKRVLRAGATVRASGLRLRSTLSGGNARREVLRRIDTVRRARALLATHPEVA